MGGEERGAPRFTLLNLKDEKVDSADFRGKVILLNFWTTWCSPWRGFVGLTEKRVFEEAIRQVL